MNQELQRAKQMIRPYLRSISEEALFRLTAMAQGGQVVYTQACKCIRGIVGGCTYDGYYAEDNDVALRAEAGLNRVGVFGNPISTIDQSGQDRFRNVRLYPMCRAEIRRRSKVSNQGVQEKEMDAVGVRRGARS